MNINKLKSTCYTAADLTEKWMLKHLAIENIVGSTISDPVLYYKWPLTLSSRGKKENASELLLWMTEKCLSDKGDFKSERSGFHLEFHSYANLWLILAAIELQEFSLADKLLGFLFRYFNKITGGLSTTPSTTKKIIEDPLSTSFLGMAACKIGNKDLAGLCLKYLMSLVERQPDQKNFFLRTKSDGSLITNIASDLDSKTYLLKIGDKDESYYFLGAICFFLANYSDTFGTTEEVSKLTNRVRQILISIGAEALSTIWAAKVGPGCVALYSVTSDEQYLDIAKPVIKTVLAGQYSEGYWLKNNQPWITVTAEQCYWLTDISKRL